MTVKDVLVQDLSVTLEETGNLMVDRMVLESLAKNGSITLEEAEFFNTLVRRVVTEAAEEFIPESLPEVGATMTLTGEDGTVYTFNQATCELIPIEGTGGADDDAAALESPGIGAEVMEEPVVESTEVEGETLVEEAEVTEEVVELTESQQIVSNLIKSLGA